jgi:translation elongation factor P/translation initiation factor 5A
MVLVTAVIDTVERDGSAISFVDSTGELRTVNVQPRAQAFAKGLQRGDEVEVAFTEAVAVSVEPAT